MNVFIRVNADNANKVIAEIKKYELRQVSEIKYTLQRYFMESVGGKEND